MDAMALGDGVDLRRYGGNDRRESRVAADQKNGATIATGPS